MIYPRLFSDTSITGMPIRNRIVMPAINHAWCAQELVTEQLAAQYARLAAGGVGTIVFGGMTVHPLGRGTAMPGLYHDRFCDSLSVFTRSVKAEGAALFAQLFHAGRYAKAQNTGADPVAPSAVYAHYSKALPRALTAEDVDGVVDDFVAAASRAQQSGFDGVELIASAGYLLASFLSPLTNQRHDGYGGSLAGRCFILVRILGGIKALLGKDFPVIVRLSGNEFIPGGSGCAQTVETAKLLESAGADLLSVTGGWHESFVPQISCHVPPGAFSYLGAAVKEAVSIPVITANRIADPLVAENILAQGGADFVAMGRALLCDPDLPRKARSGHAQYIRPCIACGQSCTDFVFSGRPLGCSLNPDLGRAGAVPASPRRHKKVLVVGGGIAGIEAALRAAGHGHSVELWEQAEALGGKLFFAAAQRKEISDWLDYAQHRLAQSGVEVSLRRTARADALAQGAYDHVLLATGSTLTPLPFDTSAFCGTVVDAPLLWKAPHLAGKNTVIIGGGALGSETAMHLGRHSVADAATLGFLLLHSAESDQTLHHLACSSRRAITLVEKNAKLGRGIGIGTKWAVLKELKLYGVVQKISCEAIAVYETGVIINSNGEECQTIECDTIVNATGFMCNSIIYDELNLNTIIIDKIGDARRPSNIFSAVKDAFASAQNI